MLKRFTTYFAGVGIVLSAALSLTALSGTVSAVVDDTPDCDNVAIIKCGADNAADMRKKAAQGDVPKIYNAFGISQNDLKGEYVNGIVWRDGRVTVGDKVVATGAMTAGRNFGGTPIAGTNAGKYPTSKFVDEGQTAFVRMVDGKFSFAIIKACGNPVTATPKQPPEQPKPKYECVSLKAEPISRMKYKFTANATASGGATIEKYEFGFGDGYGITVSEKSYTYEYKKAGTFKANIVVHVKVDGKIKKVTSPACEATVTIKEIKIKVCELATKTVITINPSEFDETKHSRVLTDCKETPATIRVCELSTKKVIEIKDNEFDETKHSRVLEDCETPEEMPAEIAKGGPGAIAAGLLGTSTLGYGAFSYLQSRRNLLGKLLGR